MSGNEPGKSEPVTVRILDREYTVGVSDGERASLTSAARLLDQRMRELRGSNKLVAPDRLAVLTALNLAHELQQLREERGILPQDSLKLLREERGGNDAVFRLLDAANARLDGLLGPAA